MGLFHTIHIWGKNLMPKLLPQLLMLLHGVIIVPGMLMKEHVVLVCLITQLESMVDIVVPVMHLQDRSVIWVWVSVRVT